MTIKKTLDSLNPEQKRQLMYAFEHEFSQHVKLPDGKFIGVNIRGASNLEITESAGNWSVGNIKGDGNAS